MTTLKLDAKALQALIATFDEETKLEFQRCVIKEVVNKSFLNDLAITDSIKEEIKSLIYVSKLEIGKYADGIVTERKESLLEDVNSKIDSIVLDESEDKVAEELIEKLLYRLLRRSSVEKHVQDYEERWKGRMRTWTEELHVTKTEFNKLLKELQQKIDNQEQMVTDIVARRLTGKE